MNITTIKYNGYNLLINYEHEPPDASVGFRGDIDIESIELMHDGDYIDVTGLISDYQFIQFGNKIYDKHHSRKDIEEYNRQLQADNKNYM